MYLIENSRIVIKRTLPAEIDFIIEMEKQGENVTFITPYDKKRHLEVIDSHDEEHLTVWEKKTNSLVGFIILAGNLNLNLSLEFRRIVIQKKGSGIGRQCLKLIKNYCFDALKFHRLWLDVFDDNIRAIHLYKSEGFKEEGKLRDVIRQGENYKSLFILSILDNEFYLR